MANKLLEMIKGRKGALGLGSLPQVAIVLFFFVIVLGVAVYAMSEFLDQLTANTTAYTVVNESIDAFTGFPTWLGLIITMVALAVVIGIVYMFQAGRR